MNGFNPNEQQQAPSGDEALRRLAQFLRDTAFAQGALQRLFGGGMRNGMGGGTGYFGGGPGGGTGGGGGSGGGGGHGGNLGGIGGGGGGLILTHTGSSGYTEP